MAVTTFAAIDIGAYEVSMKIFELSKKQGIKQIDYPRYRIELGRDTYKTGEIAIEQLHKLCEILCDFSQIMKEYGVTEYRACATSSIRELRNPDILLEQIHQKTGITVEILSNSKQRFLGYKSIASIEEDFKEIIQKGTAIVDVGGGSVQISLFDNDALVATQNLKLGNLRIRERLSLLEKESTHYEELIHDFIFNEVMSFKRLYVKDRVIENVILQGDFLVEAMFPSTAGKGRIQKAEFDERYEMLVHKSEADMAAQLGIPLEYASLVVPTAVLYKSFIDMFQAETMWVPGTVLEDGLAYHFAEENKFIKPVHNFERDIIIAAKNIAKRYSSNQTHTKAVAEIALKMFDSMRKIHGLSARERLLLHIAALLHDCGKYISLANAQLSSYNIIMSTEIIGLSHEEREMIAHIVRYNTMSLPAYSCLHRESDLTLQEYLIITKLIALLRIANELDRSHHQKVKDVQIRWGKNKMQLIVDVTKDFSLEVGLVPDKIDFFESVFDVRPVIKRSKSTKGGNA
ncbi:MAG: HD domain-containing protein [Lachnospiraceae bacterium]